MLAEKGTEEKAIVAEPCMAVEKAMVEKAMVPKDTEVVKEVYWVQYKGPETILLTLTMEETVVEPEQQ
jgi:hypothetical protein